MAILRETRSPLKQKAFMGLSEMTKVQRVKRGFVSLSGLCFFYSLYIFIIIYFLFMTIMSLKKVK
jgi:cell division septal protein FtsQ